MKPTRSICVFEFVVGLPRNASHRLKCFAQCLLYGVITVALAYSPTFLKTAVAGPLFLQTPAAADRTARDPAS